MLRKYLENYGLSKAETDKIVKIYRTVDNFMKEESQKVSNATGLSLKKVEEIKRYIVNNVHSKEIGHDLLQRWGRVTSQMDLERSYEEYEKLSRLYPNSPVIWAIKGELLEKMERVNEAKNAYQHAYQLYLRRGEIPPPELEEKTRSGKVSKLDTSLLKSITPASNGGMINGFKNGIINGTGLINGVKPPKYGVTPKGGPWKLFVSLLLVLIIVTAPFMVTYLFQKQYIYRVDGNFQEWSVGIPYYGFEKSTKNINIRFVKFHPANNGIYFFVKMLSNKAFNASSGLYIFLDTDNSSSTGYMVEGIGADYMIELYGWNSTLRGKTLYHFNSTDQQDFAGFKTMGSVSAILKNGQIEGFISIPVSHFRAVVISYDYASEEDIAPCPVYGKRAIIVTEDALQQVLPLNRMSTVLTLHFRGNGIIKSLEFQMEGTASISSLQKIALYEGNVLLSENYSISGKRIIFHDLNLEISNSTLNFQILPLSGIGKTIMLRLADIDSSVPYYIDERIIGASYIGKIPNRVSIDGSFLDWRNVKRDAANDVISRSKIVKIDSNIDLLHYASCENSSLLVYLQVQGRLLGGSDVPAVRIPTLPDSDRDTVPDKFDLYPYDFNNDGIPDNESYVVVNGIKYPDVDKDGIADYPYGPDLWLNTTIPSNFPKPYAGRHVSVYIGPVPHRKVYGMDTIDVYINSDGNVSTGFSLPQYPFGADYKVEILGMDGKAYNASLYRYSSGDWEFVKGIKYALGYHAMEMNTYVPKGDVLITLSNWRDDRDISDEPINEVAGIEKSFSSKILNFTFSKSLNFSSIQNTDVKTISPVFIGRYSSLTAVFGTDILVSNEKEKRDQARPSIVRTSDGTLWVVFDFLRANRKIHDIGIANSTDDGASWTAWRLYSSSRYNTSNPVIVKDDQDNLYVFFENHTSGAYFQLFVHSVSENDRNWERRGFQSWNWWENVYNISADTYSSYIYLSFEYHEGSSSTVAYIYSNDYGNSWIGYYYSPLTYWQGHPSLTISTGSNPRVFIIFDYYNSDDGTWHIIIANNTRVGSNDMLIFRDIKGSSGSLYDYYRYPSVYSNRNNIYIAFQEDFYFLWWHINSDIDVLISTDNGNSWSEPIQVTSSFRYNEIYPWVVADDENIYVFYLNATTGYVCMVASHDGGNTWGNAIPVSDNGTGVSLYHTLSALYSDGELYVVWTDSRGNGDIYFDKAEVPEFHDFVILMVPIIAIVIALRRREKNKH